MRNIEIILKIMFLILAIALIFISQAIMTWLWFFGLVSIVLGIVLIFNKKSSYKYPCSSKDYFIRRIEGIFLILSVFIGYLFIWATILNHG